MTYDPSIVQENFLRWWKCSLCVLSNIVTTSYRAVEHLKCCLLYTSDAADEDISV